MSRFPPLPRDKLQPDQLETHDEQTAIAQKAFGSSGDLFQWADDDGALLGPFPFALSSPEAGGAMIKQALLLGKLPLPADAKEVAILVCGVKFGAAYELYAHSAVAAKAGLSEMQIGQIKTGSKPKGLSEECSVAYDVAEYLANEKGGLPGHLYDQSVSVLGREGTIALIHYVGCYAYVCIVLNAADAPAP
nr:hypothetical protein B0A51_02429 [Rachicladosporium sp. CCFEE 5018]